MALPVVSYVLLYSCFFNLSQYTYKKYLMILWKAFLVTQMVKNVPAMQET